MTNLLLQAEPPKPVQVEPSTRYRSWDDAYRGSMNLCRYIQEAGQTVLAAAAWADRFKKFRPRDPASQLLGIGKKAVNDCERLAPGGAWVVDHYEVKQGVWQFSAWYSRLLPYMYAMTQAENSYKGFGVDFTTINSHFKTCMGYYDVAMNDEQHMHPADSALYNELYSTSCEVRRPQLPFDEMYLPACCYLYAINEPLFRRKVLHEGTALTRKYPASQEAGMDYRLCHVLRVSEELGDRYTKLVEGVKA